MQEGPHCPHTRRWPPGVSAGYCQGPNWVHWAKLCLHCPGILHQRPPSTAAVVDVCALEELGPEPNLLAMWDPVPELGSSSAECETTPVGDLGPMARGGPRQAEGRAPCGLTWELPWPVG